MTGFREALLTILSYILATIRFLIVWIATFFMGIQKVWFDGVQVENIVLSCKPLKIDLDKISYLNKLEYDNEECPSELFDDSFEEDEGDDNDQLQ